MELQVPAKTIRSNSDIENDPSTSENLPSQDNFFGLTCHYFHFQNCNVMVFSIYYNPNDSTSVLCSIYY